MNQQKRLIIWGIVLVILVALVIIFVNRLSLPREAEEDLLEVVGDDDDIEVIEQEIETLDAQLEEVEGVIRELERELEQL